LGNIRIFFISDGFVEHAATIDDALAFDEVIENLGEDGTDAELRGVQTEQQRASPERDDSFFVLEESLVGDLGAPIQSPGAHNKRRRSSSAGTGASTSGHSPEPASERNDAGAHLAKRRKRPSLSNARVVEDDNDDNNGEDAQFPAVGIEKLQQTLPISAAAKTKRSARDQPNRVSETELNATITARKRHGKEKRSNAIKSSRGRCEPTSRASPSSLPLRYDDRATGNDETTGAPTPTARQEIIHHFNRRFPQSDVVVAFALVSGLCDPPSALSYQHPSLSGEKFEDYSTYLLAPGIWAVVGVCGPADNTPTGSRKRQSNAEEMPGIFNTFGKPKRHRESMQSGGQPLYREDLELSSSEGDDNDSTDGTECVVDQRRRAWNRSEDEKLRRHVEKNLPWPEIARKHKRTEVAVRQHWWRLMGRRQQQDQDDDDEDEERRQGDGEGKE